MLKNIPSILPPDLLKLLMEMGHGDEVAIGDGNFQAAHYAQRLVRCDGHGVPALLDAILKLFPLDQQVPQPVLVMRPADPDAAQPGIWAQYRTIIKRHEPQFADFETVERFAFYERAKKAYCIVATGEPAIYANIILKKGVITA